MGTDDTSSLLDAFAAREDRSERLSQPNPKKETVQDAIDKCVRECQC